MSDLHKRLLIAGVLLVMATLCFYYTLRQGGFSMAVTLPGIILLVVAFLFIRSTRK